MRLDKFFQTTGLIKRRVLANEACKRQLAKVNGRTAKPTHEMIAGDIVEIDLPRRNVKVKILKELPAGNISRSRREEFIEIIEDVAKTPKDDDWWNDG